MTGNLTLALRTASSGLMTNQAAMDSIASNISNVNTEGYSRKIANIQQRVVNGVGAGVEIASITRNVDEGLLKTLRGEMSTLNSYSSQTSYFERLQDTFGTLQDNSSISHIIANFQSAIEQLTVSPEKTLEQREVVYQGEQIANKLNSMSDTIQDLRLQADNEIALIATEMQLLMENISTLNDSIVKGSVIDRDLTSLEDQRDQAVTRLSELIDIKYFIRDDGDLIVFSGTGHTLIDAENRDITFSAASYISSSVTEAEGDLSGIYVGTVSDSNDIGPNLDSGRLKGLLDLRDVILPNMQSQLDQLSATLRDTVNSIHNAGVPFPGLTTMNGSRIFLDTTDAANVQSQTITLDATSGVDDVAIVLFDSTGAQTASTTLDTIMTSGMYGTGTQTTHDAWSVAEVAATVEDWLQDNGAASATVALDSDGKMAVELSSLTLSLAFRDQESSTDGSTRANAEIGFDADGDGTIDETVSGFSNFFGFNDFYTDSSRDNVHESALVSSTFVASASEIRFVDGTSTLPLDPGGSADVTLSITAGDTLSDIATNINDNISNVFAAVIPDGTGFRLRISHATGEELNITQVSGTFLEDVEMHVSEVAIAETLAVRSDLQLLPSLVTRGAVQWDATLGAAGEYVISTGDQTAIAELATAMSSAVSFDSAGGIGAFSRTFIQQSGAIISLNSSLAFDNKIQVEYKETLTISLNKKINDASGVNLDEELSNLIIFEQAYSSSARIMSVIQNMLDALESIIR